MGGTDEPGDYAPARNWDLAFRAPDGSAAIEVTASGVFIGFRGFTIEYDFNGFGARSTGSSVASSRGLPFVSGTADVNDHNIADVEESDRWTQGVLFTCDGNLYGHSRMAAETPFVLNGTTQADWGGNVGF